MLRPSPGCKLEVLAGARPQACVGVTDQNLSLFTGLQGPKISRTDFSRNHSRLCSKYTRTVGYNKELLFSDRRNKFLLIVWIKAFLLLIHFLLSLLAYNFATKVRKMYEVCFWKTHTFYLPLLPTLPSLK